MKKCPKCNKRKKLSDFQKDKSKSSGFQSHCKKCNNIRRKKYYVDHAEYKKKVLWQAENPEQTLLNWAKIRAKKRGVPCTITKNHITIPEFCPVLGLKLKKAGSKNRSNSPSLDCFIPSLGYVPGNVTVISFRANMLKNNATSEEIKQLNTWMTLQNVV